MLELSPFMDSSVAGTSAAPTDSTRAELVATRQQLDEVHFVFHDVFLYWVNQCLLSGHYKRTELVASLLFIYFTSFFFGDAILAVTILGQSWLPPGKT